MLVIEEKSINTAVNKCPHCNNTYVIKYGRYKNEQRYQCKSCHKTFSARTNTPWYHSKKDLNLWVKYSKLMFNMTSLRESAKELNISLPTAFYWRHKILASIKNQVDVKSLDDSVHIVKRLRKENRKGQKNIAHIPRKNIWVYFSNDNHDGIVAKPAIVGNWDLNSFIRNIYVKIDKKSYIYPLGDRYLKIIADKHNENLSVNVEELNIYRLKNFIYLFEDAVSRYRGIASKYLRKYLFFVEIFAKRKKYTIQSIIENIISNGIHIKSKKIKEDLILEF